MVIAKDIFKKCKANDRAAQEALYRGVYTDVMRITLRYVYNDDDAKDIMNRSLLKVFTKINEFKGNHKNLGGWIRRIVINESIDFVRKQKSFNEKIELNDEDDRLDVFDQSTLDIDPKEILGLLRALPAKASSVFNLYIIEGYSHKEIGAMLNISEANSKWNLHAARKQLQMLIKERQLL